MKDKEPAISGQSIEALSGKDLDGAFNDGISWLRSVAYHPYYSGHTYKFSQGFVSFTDHPNGSVFKVDLTDEDSLEEYNIRPDEGLVSFKREANSSQIQSSVLGDLPFDENYRYFVSHIREEQIVYFGPQWLERESDRNPDAKWAMEERKRAAIKVIDLVKGAGK